MFVGQTPDQQGAQDGGSEIALVLAQLTHCQGGTWFGDLHALVSGLSMGQAVGLSPERQEALRRLRAPGEGQLWALGAGVATHPW